MIDSKQDHPKKLSPLFPGASKVECIAELLGRKRIDGNSVPESPVQVWLGPIALVVALPWDGGSLTQERAWCVLRTAAQVLNDHGLVRPTVGVVWGDDISADVFGWAAEQEWHRGEFVLYVEEGWPAAEERIREILLPLPPQLPSEVREHAPLEQLEKSLPPDNQTSAISDLLLSPASVSESEMEERLRHWIDTGERVRTESDRAWMVPAADDGSPPFPLPITRIKNVTIAHFRGFTQADPPRHSLDTDAHLVLLLGANGHGKTSFIDALLLLLTGYMTRERDSVETVVADGEQRSPDRPRIEAEVVDGKQESHQIVAQLPGDSAEWVFSDNGKRFRSRRNQVWPGTEVDAELQYRLTAFYQDRVQDLLDEFKQGHGLADYICPLGDGVRAFRAVAPGVIAWIDEQIRRQEKNLKQSGAEVGQQIWREFVQSIDPLQKLVEQIRALRELEGEPEGRLDLGSYRSWENLKATLGLEAATPTALYEWALNAVRQSLAELESEEAPEERPSARIEDLERQLRSVVEKLEERRQHWPDPWEDMKWFEADGDESGDRPQLQLLFDWLERRRDVWRKPPPPLHDHLHEVAAEFELVEPDRVAMCQRVINRALAVTKYEIDRRQKLEEERDELAQEIERIEKSELFPSMQDEKSRKWLLIQSKLEQFKRNEWEAVDQHWKEHEAWRATKADEANFRSKLEQLRERKKTIDQVLRMIDETAALEGRALEVYETSLDRVLKGFHIAGFGTVKVNEESTGWIAQFGDGRGSDHLSTGQLGQLAVATMITQKLLAATLRSHQFPNQILLMDDVSSSYDLTNLTREALLWRQLAYQKRDGAPRMQLFISSHHDSMNHHLLHLLVPPPGCKMKVLTFDEWTLEGGPQIGEHNIPPSREVGPPSGELCNDLKESIKGALCARA